MRKVVFLLALVWLMTPKEVDAALVNIREGEGVVWNVLSYEDELEIGVPTKESLAFKNIAQAPTPGPDSSVTLSRKDGKVSLRVISEGGTTERDVTGFSHDLIEIEERDEPKRVVIINLDDGFGISQRGILAKTIYAINVDSKDRKISVEAPSGLRYVAILPYEALSGLLKADIIDRLNPEEQIRLSEGEKGELEYNISGEKIVDLFNLVDLPVSVTTSVSASTGEVLHVDQPVWLGVLSFLFA